MARTIAEIYDALNASKSNFEELNGYTKTAGIADVTADTAMNLAVDVTSGSKVAVWRLWLWIFAVGSWLVETLFDRHSSHINEILASERPHTLRWYAEESKKYQHGYGMIWENNSYKYEVDDPQSKIIRYAAASEKGGTVMLKVAKDSGGSKAPLTLLEKNAFASFWSRWKDAGVRLQIVSQAPDQLKVNITIIRDRMVLDSNNHLIRDNSVSPIDDAIEAFGSSLEFDGILRLSKLQDAIQAAEGVVDVKISGAWHKPYGGTWNPVVMFVEPVAGYFTINQNESSFEYHDNVETTVFD